jgi:uncharacterized protein (DUF362 family)/Pyruvate/2-oxoacid:ferredoxin oxidoreductase delta subunit
MPKVALVKCDNYSQQTVASSIKEIFELLQLSGLIKPGQKVLLKPNLLTNLAPERGATTHPAVVKAIADEVIRIGAFPFVGDSPGGANLMYDNVLKETGMKALGLPIVNFEEKGMRKFDNPGGNINPIYISNTALSFDLIINIPKLKTHELTLMTCGIKNIFGCVPGLQKINYHLEAPTKEAFSEALVDLFARIMPAITITDAITVMEGQGPANGGLKHLGLIVASTDTVALDAVCSKILRFAPLDILTTKIANQRGLGEADISKIEITGEKIPEDMDFEHPTKVSAILKLIPGPIKHLIKPLIDMIKIRPMINRNKCVKCMMCVRSCPVKAIDGKSFKINKNKCIMCFCCRELCKYNAVDLKESILWKILSGKKKTRT